MRCDKPSFWDKIDSLSPHIMLSSTEYIWKKSWKYTSTSVEYPIQHWQLDPFSPTCFSTIFLGILKIWFSLFAPFSFYWSYRKGEQLFQPESFALLLTHSRDGYKREMNPNRFVFNFLQGFFVQGNIRTDWIYFFMLNYPTWGIGNQARFFFIFLVPIFLASFLI